MRCPICGRKPPMKLQLIDNWRAWYKRWSTWLAAAYATGTVLLLQNSGMVLGLVGFLPDPWRTVAAIATGFILFAVPVLTVHVKQGSVSGQA